MNSSIKTIYRAIFDGHNPRLVKEPNNYKVEIYIPTPTDVICFNLEWPPRVAFFEGELVEVVIVNE